MLLVLGSIRAMPGSINAMQRISVKDIPDVFDLSMSRYKARAVIIVVNDVFGRSVSFHISLLRAKMAS